MQAIVESDRPLTAAELSSGGATLKQRTTYQNLARLEQAGVVHRVLSSDDHARFELSEELGEHHHHLVCVTCGSVEDFTPLGRFERGVASDIGVVATSTGFRTQAHRLDLLGVCGICRP